MNPGTRSIGLTLCLALAVIAGCSVGPDYKRPAALKSEPVPAAFNTPVSTNNVAEWKTAEPSAYLPRGAWWQIFNELELDRLETLAATENQDLAAAVARLEESRANLGIAKADFYPQLSATPEMSRQRSSAHAPLLAPNGTSHTYDTFSTPLNLSWELDLWGRVRRQVQAARANFVASADDLESARLALQAEVASDYFSLRELDEEHRVVADTIETFRRSLELTQNRRKGGIVSDLDVSQAETQLRSTEAELPAIDLQRARVLHALAVLCGRSAIDFQLAIGPLTNAIPNVPASLPSELLERRPDIAAAERRMAAANAQIGVAVSAFYPQVFLSGFAGYQSVGIDTLFDWPSRIWSLGPSVTLPIFTGGRNRSQLAGARATFDEIVANYRQTVLSAFQEVEDQLAAQHLLATQLNAQSAALTAARRTLEIANNRYKAGVVTYLEVATAQNAELDNERLFVQLEGQRLNAQVGLIKAVGGGWEGNPDNRVARMSPAEK
ncbi:MAG TPA: efflux transporter outer membrane subunit [Verrucomicrobiae bacterium]|jgi:multidrug efflux system outer membrane protein|nr:efflux transporter outer membrane subunit [Verrucomicrobiae bacterium]